jgi:hypothetical protein
MNVITGLTEFAGHSQPTPRQCIVDKRIDLLQIPDRQDFVCSMQARVGHKFPVLATQFVPNILTVIREPEAHRPNLFALLCDSSELMSWISELSRHDLQFMIVHWGT